MMINTRREKAACHTIDNSPENYSFAKRTKRETHVKNKRKIFHFHVNKYLYIR